MVSTEFWDAESDLGTQMTLHSVEQAKRHAEGQRMAKEFLSILAMSYGVAETIVEEALKDASPEFVRLQIEIDHAWAVTHKRSTWQEQLHYRYVVMAFNNLTSS